jgi:hypothetical protein
MTAKEYLEQVRRLNNEINSLIVEYEMMQTLATKVTASCEGERVQASGNQDKIGSAVVKLIEYQEKINRKIDAYVDMRDDILQVLHKLSRAEYIDVLYKRYFEFKKWEQIACEIFMGFRGTLKLHAKALNELDRILEKRG